MNSLLFLSLVFFIFIANFPEEGKSECCFPTFTKLLLRCHDGSYAKPYCGIGTCNSFGCNCDGGCRYRKKRSVIDEPNGFGPYDTNGDGKLSKDEALKLPIQFLSLEETVKAFDEKDTDNDGFLDIEEADR